MTGFELLLSRLKGVQRLGPGHARALCPAHDDSTPSLDVRLKDSETLVFHCHARCAPEAVRAKTGLRWEDILPPREKLGRVITATYDYTDAEGKPLFQVVRFVPKNFRQRRKAADGSWIWNLDGVARVLYRLPELLASDPAEPVFLVEGEKDADRLASLGLTATTNPGGAGKWRDSYCEPLRGRAVVIIPDNDDAGRKHAEQPAQSLAGVARKVAVLALPGLSEKGDISSWLDSGGTANELLRLADAVLQRPPISQRSAGIHLVSLAELMREPEEEVAWLVEDLLPSSGISVLSAKPKVGKSTLARQLAHEVSGGESFLGRRTHAGPVIYLALEEKRAEVRRHFHSMGAVDGEVHLHFGSAPENAVPELRRLVAKIRPGLLIVDPLFRLARVKDVSDYAAVLNALEPLLSLARDTGTHVLLVHHSVKGERSGGDSILGSTGIFGSVDTAIMLRRGEQSRTISSIQRYGPDLEETVLDFDPESRIVSLGDTKERADEARVAREIEDFLAGSGAATREAIEERVEARTGLKRRAIQDLIKAGRLERTGAGRRGDPFVYRIKPAVEASSDLSCSLVPPIYGEQENKKQETGLSDSPTETNSCSLFSAVPEGAGSKNSDTGNTLPSQGRHVEESGALDGNELLGPDGDLLF